MKIDKRVLDILQQSNIDNNILFLPNEKLDRNTYLEVNKVLELIGGKWNRKAGGHVFDHCPSDHIDQILISGEVTDSKKTFQFFPTPINVARQLCELAEIDASTSVLEPSCGKGNISDVAYSYNPRSLVGIELNKDLESFLKEKPYEVIVGMDFLEYNNGNWDRIVMNPPFSNQQDIDHVMHAYDLLAENGVLVAIMFLSFKYRTTKKSIKFRQLLEDTNAEVIALPSGTFKDSGTMVETCIVVIRK